MDHGILVLDHSSSLPSGKLTLLWQMTTLNGKTQYQWPFSIALSNYERVYLENYEQIREMVKSET